MVSNRHSLFYKKNFPSLLTPRVGLEPTTTRLTAVRSTNGCVRTPKNQSRQKLSNPYNN